MRTAIPVDGRFEHIVLSCNATSDHGIIWIEREAEKALQVRGITLEFGILLYVMLFSEHYFKTTIFLMLLHKHDNFLQRFKL